MYLWSTDVSIDTLKWIFKSLDDVVQMKPNIPISHPFLRDEWELPKEEFSVGEELGNGYFATVHRGRWKNLINVAIKILKSGAD